MGSHERDYMTRWALTTLAVVFLTIGGCDLFRSRTLGIGNGRKPTNLSRPDSVLAILVYIFDQHTAEAVQDYSEILYDGYVYRYEDPSDQQTFELDRASEVQVYTNIFENFENISASFIPEGNWVEYGSHMVYPSGTPSWRVSEEHPQENWTVIRVLGEMEFTNTDDSGIEQGYEVKQYFDLAFRLDPTQKDSTWQLASWTDLESLLLARE